MGDKGIPIAPELARVCTAYMLLDYNPPPQQVLTLYFDDLAATFPIDTVPLSPYTVKPTDDNMTQDCQYDPTTKKFLPDQQKYRQPVLLYPQGYHPSPNMAKNTHKSPAFRATKLERIPRQPKPPSYQIPPALVRKGHRVIPTIESLFKISYFPRKSEKQELETKPIIKYT